MTMRESSLQSGDVACPHLLWLNSTTSARFIDTGLLGRGRRMAVEHVTFRIEPGQVFGLLGPNRAGKTTLVKVLLSLCRPTSGGATRFQRPLADRQTLARVGYVHENPAFPRYLTARALLEYFGGLALLPAPLVRQPRGGTAGTRGPVRPRRTSRSPLSARE